MKVLLKSESIFVIIILSYSVNIVYTIFFFFKWKFNEFNPKNLSLISYGAIAYLFGIIFSIIGLKIYHYSNFPFFHVLK